MKPTKIQEKAIKEIKLRKKVLLEMDCRMGKSFIALKASEGLTTSVVCPPGLKNNWELEIKKAGRLDVSIIKTTEKTKFKFIRSKVLIIDEAHKSMKWKTSEQLLRKACQTEIVYMLTATALINHPIDYYWPLKICQAHNMNLREFAIRYNGAIVGQYNQIILKNPTNKEELINLKNKFTLTYRRDLKLIKKNIDLGHSSIGTNVELEDYSTTQSLLAIAKVDNIKVKKAMMTIFSKHSKVLFLFFHKIVRETLCRKSKYLDGSVNINKRYKIIKDFIKNKEKQALFLNYKSCGEGLDIPADAVVFIERTWSKALDYQAYMRAYGFEREMPLYVYFINFTDESRLLVSAKKTDKNKGLIISH